MPKKTPDEKNDQEQILTKQEIELLLKLNINLEKLNEYAEEFKTILLEDKTDKKEKEENKDKEEDQERKDRKDKEDQEKEDIKSKKNKAKREIIVKDDEDPEENVAIDNDIKRNARQEDKNKDKIRQKISNQVPEEDEEKIKEDKKVRKEDKDENEVREPKKLKKDDEEEDTTKPKNFFEKLWEGFTNIFSRITLDIEKRFKGKENEKENKEIIVPKEVTQELSAPQEIVIPEAAESIEPLVSDFKPELPKFDTEAKTSIASPSPQKKKEESGGVDIAKVVEIVKLLGTAAAAEGGTMSKNQPFIVGERGPELVVPQDSGKIDVFNDPQLKAMTGKNTNELFGIPGHAEGTPGAEEKAKDMSLFHLKGFAEGSNRTGPLETPTETMTNIGSFSDWIASFFGPEAEALSKAFGDLLTRMVGVVEEFNKLTVQLARYNGKLAATIAIEEAKDINVQVERGQKYEEPLSEVYKESAEIWRNIQSIMSALYAMGAEAIIPPLKLFGSIVELLKNIVVPIFDTITDLLKAIVHLIGLGPRPKDDYPAIFAIPSPVTTIGWGMPAGSL